jgi:hypothetical protein
MTRSVKKNLWLRALSPGTALRRIVIATLSVVATVAASALIASPAQAASYNGVCETGEFCLYYNSGNQGSLRDFPGSIPSYGEGATCHKFISAGAGQGQCVKNNAASAWNRQAPPVTVFYKSGYAGAIDNFSPGSKADLRPALKNENAGHLVGSSLNTALSTGLYKNADARITAYFDGYLSQSGRHEGTDMARYSGAPVYALVSGTVTRVVEGSTSTLSSLAVYHSGLNKTVIYLHLDPLGSPPGSQSPRASTSATRTTGQAALPIPMSKCGSDVRPTPRSASMILFSTTRTRRHSG